MTKYGHLIEDHEWTEPEPDEPEASTSITSHMIDIIQTYDPDEDHGYGRTKYTVHISYDERVGGAHVTHVVEHQWKGNYWRDVTDWDWNDIPETVQTHVVRVLDASSSEDLDSGVRVIDEGGESRWEKYHARRVQELEGDQMWGLSFLRDALKSTESAAEAVETDERTEIVEDLVEDIKSTIREIDSSTGGESE